MLEQLPYSLDLASCDLFHISELKGVVMGNHFDDVDDIKRLTTVLKGVVKNASWVRFQRKRKSALDSNGVTFKRKTVV